MPHRNTYLTPGTAGIAISKFDKVQRILDIRIQLVHWYKLCAIELASHAAVENWQRFSTYIFCKLKIFEKSQPESLEIIRCRPMSKFVVPAVDDELTLIQSAKRFFPLITKTQIK